MNKPRCLKPLKEFKDGDINPVCWLPLGHKSRDHMSRKAWINAKERSARQYERYLEKRKQWEGSDE